ncbi:hypothetical protein BpHYR1_021979 [Brachionus plicatilis]|uniref:Uncharacterized protein n=1 Tax=Brachionus plicatilis TaxID=10195 RepID=A0A3M7QNV0_BRAPC|nr:hypothetical protein BpHYR1_021979 [Brachionus plicatilis]
MDKLERLPLFSKLIEKKEYILVENYYIKETKERIEEEPRKGRGKVEEKKCTNTEIKEYIFVENYFIKNLYVMPSNLDKDPNIFFLAVSCSNK